MDARSEGRVGGPLSSPGRGDGVRPTPQGERSGTTQSVFGA